MPEGDYVQYVGESDVRKITGSEWAAQGVSGSTVEFNRDNGYTRPKSEFTTEQLGVMAATGDFRFDGKGTTRPGSAPQSAGRVSNAGTVALGWLGKWTRKHMEANLGGHRLTSPNGHHWVPSISNAGVVTWTDVNATP